MHYKEISEYQCHVNKKVLEQCPHVRARVNLLHLDLGVNVAVIQEADVCHLHLVRNNSKTRCKFKAEVSDSSVYTISKILQNQRKKTSYLLRSNSLTV